MLKNNRILISVICLILLNSCTFLGMKTIPLEKLKAQYADGASQFITIEGIKIHYRDEGSGPPLVLLHGICSSLHTWDGWVRELKQHYRIIRFDLPGFGLTGPVPKKFHDPDRGIKLMDQLVQTFKLEHFYLAGNSLGGFLSWKYALKYPHKVTRLILVDPAGYNQKFPWLVELSCQPLIRPFAKIMMPRIFFDIAIGGFLGIGGVYGDKTLLTPEIKQRYFDMSMRKGNRGSYLDIFMEMRKRNANENIGEQIPQIKTPLLVMWGAEDRWIPIQNFAKWTLDLPDAAFIAYEGAGHTPMEELPRQTARDAHHFLNIPN